MNSGPITVEQASWIGSLLCVGEVFGMILFYVLTRVLGKKLALQLSVITHFVRSLRFPVDNPMAIALFLGILAASVLWQGSVPTIHCQIHDGCHWWSPAALRTTLCC